MSAPSTQTELGLSRHRILTLAPSATWQVGFERSGREKTGQRPIRPTLRWVVVICAQGLTSDSVEMTAGLARRRSSDAAASMPAESAVGAIVAAGVVSLFSSVLYLLLAAPDVGMTEAAIGSGLTTFLFFYVLNKIKRKND